VVVCSCCLCANLVILYEVIASVGGQVYSVVVVCSLCCDCVACDCVVVWVGFETCSVVVCSCSVCCDGVLLDVVVVCAGYEEYSMVGA